MNAPLAPFITALTEELKRENDLAKLKELILEVLTDLPVYEVECTALRSIHAYESPYGERIKFPDLREAANTLAHVLVDEIYEQAD